MATPFAKHCLLTRGQEVMVEVDDSRWRIITLPPAEMSLHHARLVHGSPPNPSGDRRIGFAIRYTPTDVAQLAGEDSATLARGEDRHRHFMSEPAEPRSRPEFGALHRSVTEVGARILYRGADLASLQRAQGAGATRLNRPGAPWAPNTEVAFIIGLCYFIK